MNQDSSSHWQLFIDGAARGNPGPSGIGIYLTNGHKFLKRGFYIGERTNNQAEYLALIMGLLLINKLIKNCDSLSIKSDSQLLVRQVLGIYKVKNLQLKKLFDIVMSLLPEYFKICHIPREENTMADSLANMAIDKKIMIPDEFREIWQKYANL